MFDLPLHPFIVHFPIAIGILMPMLVVGVGLGIKLLKWPHQTWWMIVFFQTVVVASSVIAVVSGEKEEERPGPPLNQEQLAVHEEAGETIPWTAGVALILSMAPLIMPKKMKGLALLFLIVSLGIMIQLIYTGHSGGQLIYNSSVIP